MRDQINKRCDSCGNKQSHKKYNGNHLCFECLRFGKDGRSRDYGGNILYSIGNFDEHIKQEFLESRKMIEQQENDKSISKKRKNYSYLISKFKKSQDD